MPPKKYSGTIHWPPTKDAESEADSPVQETSPADFDSFGERKAELRRSITALEAAAKKDKRQEPALLAAEDALRKLENDSKEGERFFEERRRRDARETDAWARRESRLLDQRQGEESITDQRMRVRAANAEAQEGLRKRRAALEGLEREARSSHARASDALETRGPLLENRIREFESQIKPLPEQGGEYGKDTVLSFFKERMASFQEGLKGAPTEERSEKLAIARKYMQRAVELSEKLPRAETSNELEKMQKELSDILGNYERLHAGVAPVPEAAEQAEKDTVQASSAVDAPMSTPENAARADEKPFSESEAELSTAEGRLRDAKARLAQIGERLDEMKSEAAPEAPAVRDETSAGPEPMPTGPAGPEPAPVPSPEAEAPAEPSPEAPWTGPVPISIEGLLTGDKIDANAIQREADRYYDESIARLDFILPYHHRKLSEHRSNIGYLARDIGDLKDGRKRRKLIAELKSEVAAMHSAGLEMAEMISHKENNVSLREVAPEAFVGQPEPRAERPEKKSLLKRKRTWLGLLGLAGAAAYMTTEGDNKSEAPTSPVPTASREAAGTGGAPTAETAAAPVEARVVEGRGAERLFSDLQSQLRQRYGSRTDIPNVSRILAVQPGVLAEQLGFSARRAMIAGERLSVDSHGVLRFHYADNRQPAVLINARGEVRRVEDVVIANRPSTTVRTAPLRAPRTERPATPSAPQSAPDIEVVDGRPTNAVPTPAPASPDAAPTAPAVPANPPAQAPRPRVEAVPPPSTTSPEAPATTPAAPAATPQAERPATPPSVERAPQTPSDSIWTGSIERLEQAPAWQQSSSANALGLFENPAPEGSPQMAVRQSLFNVMKETGVGPNPNETAVQYLARARAARERGGVVTPFIVQTPGPTPLLVAHGGDLIARQILARTLIRQMLEENPQANVGVIVEDEPGSGSRGFLITSDLFRAGANDVTGYTPVENLRIQLPPVTSSMTRVF